LRGSTIQKFVNLVHQHFKDNGRFTIKDAMEFLIQRKVKGTRNLDSIMLGRGMNKHEGIINVGKSCIDGRMIRVYEAI